MNFQGVTFHSPDPRYYGCTKRQLVLVIHNNKTAANATNCYWRYGAQPKIYHTKQQGRFFWARKNRSSLAGIYYLGNLDVTLISLVVKEDEARTDVRVFNLISRGIGVQGLSWQLLVKTLNPVSPMTVFLLLFPNWILDGVPVFLGLWDPIQSPWILISEGLLFVHCSHLPRNAWPPPWPLYLYAIHYQWSFLPSWLSLTDDAL